jgi:hypothetical protein
VTSAPLYQYGRLRLKRCGFLGQRAGTPQDVKRLLVENNNNNKETVQTVMEEEDFHGAPVGQ